MRDDGMAQISAGFNGNIGTVYWITGLSGSGKTTIGMRLFEYIKQSRQNVVLLDGDEIRYVIGKGVIGYSQEERKQGSYIGSRLCWLLSKQGIDVIACTISMSNEIRDWNRKNIASYKEVFLDVPIEILTFRDSKGIYDQSKSNIVGIDIVPEYPQNPDITIINDGSETTEEIVERLVKELHIT